MTIYYYKGQAVRSSKRNTYKYGLYCPTLDRILALSSTKQGAAKENNSYINMAKRNIEAYKKEGNLEMVEAIKKELEEMQARYVVELEKVEK